MTFVVEGSEEWKLEKPKYSCPTCGIITYDKTFLMTKTYNSESHRLCVDCMFKEVAKILPHLEQA